MKLASLVFVLVVASGCRLFESSPILFPNARTYAHDLFASPEECSEAQRVSFINCAQVLVLCPTGDAEFVVTDIIHRASYSIEGPRLRLRVPDNPEIRSEHVFAISKDELSLRLLSNNTLWARREAPDAEAQRACDLMAGVAP